VTLQALFDLILHFFSLGPPVANLCAKFEVSIFNPSRDMGYEIWHPLYISGTVEARNLKFGMAIDHCGT